MCAVLCETNAQVGLGDTKQLGENRAHSRIYGLCEMIPSRVRRDMAG